MLKNYNYMLTILIYPFLLVMCYLKLNNLISGSIYNDLILIMLIIFIPSFIMSLYGASEEILKSKKKWRIVLLVLLSVFYLPIYYTKYVSKEEKYLGYILFIVAVPLTVFVIDSCQKRLSKYFDDAFLGKTSINENYVYKSKNNLFSIKVDSTFRCNNGDIGDYVISCDRLEDDSFIGVYSYDVSLEDEEEIKEKIDFHVKQTIDYIEEKGYTYEMNTHDNTVEILYNDNIVLITQNNYMLDDTKYSLIIMKEMPKEYINYEEYQKMIDSINFLNYNERESS